MTDENPNGYKVEVVAPIDAMEWLYSNAPSGIHDSYISLYQECKTLRAELQAARERVDKLEAFVSAYDNRGASPSAQGGKRMAMARAALEPAQETGK